MSARAREAVGATQEGLAARAGVSPRTVRRYETGRRVSPDTMRRIEEALGIERGDVPAAVREREADRRPMRIPALDTTVIGARIDMRVERHGAGWVAWWPSAPHALGLDGMVVDTSAAPAAPFAFAAFSHAVAAACAVSERGREALAAWHREGRGPSPGDRHLWAYTLGLLVTAGLPLPEALATARGTMGARVQAGDLPADPARPATIDPRGILPRLVSEGADRMAIARAMVAEASRVAAATA